MSVTSGFFNSLSGDRKYDAIQISSMFDGLITDGIYNGYLESFMVTASSPASMVVTVGEGRCWFNHTWTLNDAPLPLTLDVGDVVLNRIDTIVIDVDSTDTVRACTIKIIKGTPSSQAVRPTLENTETHHQYPLCDISVPAGATTVTQSNITNRRGTSDCPFVATLMESVDVDDLLIQWESQWNDWMTDRANSMDSWTAEQQEAFTTWFQTVQDILDENTAGNLLNRINHRTGINATATYSAGVVAITAPDDAGEILTFVAPSDFLSSDTYTLNGEALTITDLNGEALDDSWKKDSPVTITVSGGKAFFKAGGSGKNDTLPPLLGNMTVEVVEGDENDTYTIKMDKLVLDKTTEMVGGAQLEWGEEMPAKPGKGTGGIKTWTREEIITTGKPYDGLYLGDVTPSDAVTETLLWLPENDGGSVKLVPFIVLSTDYLGGVYVMRKHTSKDFYGLVRNQNGSYFGGGADVWITNTYLNSVLGKNVSSALLDCEITTAGVNQTRKCWIPGMPEVGSNNHPGDGEKMPYFASDQRRIAYDEDTGTPHVSGYWTRTQASSTHNFSIRSTGESTQTIVTNFTCYRPSFVLPKDFKIQQRPDGSYTVYNDMGLMTLGDIEASGSLRRVDAHYFENGSIVDAIYLSDHYNEFDVGVILRDKCLSGVANNISRGTNVSVYSSSVVNSVMQSYKSKLSESFRSYMKDVTVKSMNTTVGTSANNTLTTSIAVPNVQELNLVSGWDTGESFSYFNSDERRKANRDDGTYEHYRTRDIADVLHTYFVSGTQGTLGMVNQNALYGGRPMMFVDKMFPIRALADGTYDLVPEDPALSGTTKSISVMAETSGTPIQLKDIPVGSILKFKEEGTETEFRLIAHNYELDLNPDSIAFIARKDKYKDSVYTNKSGDYRSAYDTSLLDSDLNGEYLNKFDDNTKSHIVNTKLEYGLIGSGIADQVSTMTRKVFAFSLYEAGLTKSDTIKVSNALEGASYLRGYGYDVWTRDPLTYSTHIDACFVNNSGVATNAVANTYNKGFVPCFCVLESDVFSQNSDGTYTFVGDEPESSEFVSHTVEVPHGQKVVFRQFTQNQKKQFQTMLVGGVYPPLGEVEPPEPSFILPEFTGNNTIFGDEIAGRIELYESGTLTLYPGIYDFFLVGGGGGNYAAGGGGGYTKTIKTVEITEMLVIPVVIGAGGGANGGGSITTLLHSKLPDGGWTVNGGKAGSSGRGGSGGSGGGGNGSTSYSYYDADGGPGGSNGNNGGEGEGNNGKAGGAGQGKTTRMFEDPGGTLYAGGGGGNPDPDGGSYGRGGAGGGGTNSGGTPNTGGGAGGKASGVYGGSGIIGVRWNLTA